MAQEKGTTSAARQIEMYVGKPNKTWYTTTVTVRVGWFLDDAEVVARAKKQLETALTRARQPFVFVGVYALRHPTEDSD